MQRQMLRGVWAVIVILMVTGGGCASLENGCSRMNNAIQGGDYHVTLYAADGSVIREFDLVDVLIESDSSAGFVWYENQKIRQVSGTYVVEQR